MIKFLTRRLISSAITLVGVVVMVFFLARLTGSPVDVFFPEGASPERIEAFNRVYGLDRPVLEQFQIFLWRAIQGDFGDSIWQQRPAMVAAWSEMPITIALAAISLSVSTAIAVVLGSLAAAYRFGAVDRGITFFSLTLGSMPTFWFALVGILLFAIHWKLVPTSGINSWQAWILPVATLCLQPIGVLTQVVRGAMIDVLTSGFVRNARARGFSSSRLLFRHALRNAALPIISVAGDIAAGMVNGAVIAGVVFAFPGIGKLIVDAVLARDFPVLQASVVVVGISVILLNLVVDVIYVLVDPRVRLS